MIIPTNKSLGRPSAIAKCDDCGHESEMACSYDRTPSNKWVPNEGQVINRANQQGWSFAKRRLLCPKCTKQKKEANAMSKQKPASGSNVAPIRGPNREQKRLIIMALVHRRRQPAPAQRLVRMAAR